MNSAYLQQMETLRRSLDFFPQNLNEASLTLALTQAREVVATLQSFRDEYFSVLPADDQKPEETGQQALLPEENPNPILRVRCDGAMVYANASSREALEFWGCQIGQQVPEFLLAHIIEVSKSGEKRVVDLQVGEKVFGFTLAPILRNNCVDLYGSDVTERVRFEQQLRISNARLAAVLESITEAYFVLDREWRLIDFNQIAEREFLKKPREQLIGKVFWEKYPAAVGNEFWKQYHKAFETGKPVHFEALSGLVPRWYEVHAYPRGDLLEIYLHDIDQRRREQADRDQLLTELKESKDRLDLVLRNTPIVVYTTDSNLRYTWVYRHPLSDVSEEELLGRRFEDLDPSADVAELIGLKRQVLKSGAGMRREVTIKTAGQVRIFDVTVDPIHDPLGQAVGVAVSGLELTGQRAMEKRVAETDIHLEIQRQIIEQREMERMEIARDLHDGPVQELIAAEYGLIDIEGTLDESERLEKIRQLREMIQRQIKELRVFCSELRPPALAPFGLQKAIESHAHDFQKKYPNLTVQLDLAKDGSLLPEPVRMAMFRIYQELLNNVARHSGAKWALVRLHLNEQWVDLEVQDDGAGFKLPARWLDLARQGHLGLVGIHERLDAIKGSIQVQSSPGAGTTVHVSVPMEKNEVERG